MRIQRWIDWCRENALYLLFGAFVLITILHFQIIDLEIQGKHSWRQTQTMLNVRNFVRYDANILNPRNASFNGGKDSIARFEFPIMQYFIAMLMKVFGEKIMVARLFLLLQCFFLIYGFFILIKLITKDALVALLTSILLLFSPLIYYYGINPLPDNLALLASVYFVYFTIKYERETQNKFLYYAGFFLLLATLAKLPYVQFAVLTAYYFFRRLLQKKYIESIFPALIPALILIPAVVWYAWVFPTWSSDSVAKGIFSSSADFSQISDLLEYHRKIMFPDQILYLPAWLFSIFGIGALFLRKTAYRGEVVTLFSISLIYLLYEITWIDTNHDYYMMPFLISLFMLVALGINFLFQLRKPVLFLLVIGFILFAPIYAYSQYNKMWFYPIDNFNQDVYRYRQELQDIVPDDEICIILNDHSGYIFAYNIDKMGHIFNNNLEMPWIGDMIDNHGARYLYSDSEEVNNDPELDQYVDSLILEAGSVKVFKLRAPQSDTIKYLPFFKQPWD